MPKSAYEAYRLAQMRMRDDQLEAERQRLAKSVQQQNRSPGWLKGLVLRRRGVTSGRLDGEGGDARRSLRRAAPSATR